MSIDSVKPKSDNMSTFSYAQAAKGQAPVQTASTQAAPAAPNAPPRPEPSVPGSTASSTFDSAATNSSQSTNPEPTASSARDADLTSAQEETAPAPKDSSEAAESHTTGAEKTDGDSSTQDSEKRSKDGNSADKKNKKGKKAKNGDKDAEQDQSQEKEDEKEDTQPPPVLAEAPLPAVNIWQQRKEAQAAKVSVAPVTGTAASDTQSTPSADQKQRVVNSGVAENGTDGSKTAAFNGQKAQRKPAEATRHGEQGFKKGASRSARAADKDGKPFEPLPSITNPASWPTPETAASGPKAPVAEQKPTKEEGDELGPSAPRPKGKWTTLDFVPTVSFETPLPIRGGARGGSRSGSSRGGREGSSRGNHSAGPSTATDRTHDHASGPRGGAGAGSQASKRASVDSAAPREAKKAPAATDATKSSDQSSAAASKPDAPAKQAPAANTVSQGQHQSSSRTSTTDVRPEFAQKSADGAGNSTSARDANSASNSGSHRGSERGRGGGRGRGGHSSTNGSTHHGQNHFAHQGSSFSYPSNAPSRSSTGSFSNSYQQVPYNASFPQSTGAHRGRPSNARQQNGGGRHPNTRPPPPMQQPVPMTYDPAMYPQAVPPAYNFFETQFMPLVQQQLEYYFSIDNLCKDWFLRKHMDSQGFVALNVIAGFKRMRDLVPDYSVVRMVGEQSLLVELIACEDGVDRVRRRENWTSWVLPKDQRDPSAQHDGIKAIYHNPRPVHASFHPHPMHTGYAPESPAMFSPTGNSHFQGYMNGVPPQASPPAVNGVNGLAPAAESQLSATVPEFSPVGDKEPPQTNGISAAEGVAN